MAHQPYSILQTYTTLLAGPSAPTIPIAAIQALHAGLAPAATTAETLKLVSSLTVALLRGAPPGHRIGITAGTDLFQKFLELGGTVDTVDSLVANAHTARALAAGHGARLVREGDTVLTSGASRCVSAALRFAVEENGKRFRVIYARGSQKRGGEETESIAALRALGIPVAEIPATAVAHSMGAVTVVLVGAEGVVKNGGIVGKMGTYQLAELAKGQEKPFYVIAEMHKFTRLFPLGQFRLGVEQNILDFRPAEPELATDEAVADVGDEGKESEVARIVGEEDAVDYTPPHLLAGIVTEGGCAVTGAVSDTITKMWM